MHYTSALSSKLFLSLSFCVFFTLSSFIMSSCVCPSCACVRSVVCVYLLYGKYVFRLFCENCICCNQFNLNLSNLLCSYDLSIVSSLQIVASFKQTQKVFSVCWVLAQFFVCLSLIKCVSFPDRARNVAIRPVDGIAGTRPIELYFRDENICDWSRSAQFSNELSHTVRLSRPISIHKYYLCFVTFVRGAH